MTPPPSVVPSWRHLFATCSSLLLAAVLSGAGTAAAAPKPPALEVPLIVTQVPVRPAAGTPSTRDSRAAAPTATFEGARIVRVAQDRTVRVLSQGFHAACDPNVSFDGKHVLFAGRRSASDRWRVWEIGIDGEGLRAVSPEHLEARQPIYVSTLFTLNSPEPWFTTVFVGYDSAVNEAGGPVASSLYNVKLDGGELRRLTFNPNLNADPFQTWDGRVLYSAERHPNEPGPAGRRSGIYAIHTEGADMEFFGGSLGRRVQRMPCATAGGLIVFVENDQPTADGSGQLGCLEQRRPHRTYRPLTKEGAHVYLYPAPLRGNEVLVARRDARGKGTWGIARFDAQTQASAMLFDDPTFHEVQAVVAQPRPRPDGHSTIVNTQDNYGVLYGLNCYTTDAQRAGKLQRGEVKRVRLIEGVLPAPGAQPAPADPLSPVIPRRLIGEAPVEPDGSFSLHLPADTPMMLQTLDERGLALGNCGWIWVKPRENRGCIGCHEDPELVPENIFVMSLQRKPTRLLPAPEERVTVSFRENIAPILQQHCATAECHGGTTTPLRLRLTSSAPTEQDLRATYEALMAAQSGSHPRTAGVPAPGRYVDPGRARTSWLVWELLGADTSRPWDQPAAGATPVPKRKVMLMPPPGKGSALTDAEIQTVIQWIDMGAAYAAPHTSPKDTKTIATTP